jgi:DNA-directed RNA polymerase
MKDDMITVQNEIEEESLGISIKRYRENLASRGEDNLPPGLKLIKKSIEPLGEAIQKCIDDGLEGKASRSVSLVQYLSQFDPHAVAFMTARTCIHHVGSASKVQVVAVEIATVLEGMLNFDYLKEQHPGAYRQLKKHLKLFPGLSASSRHIYIRKQQQFVGLARIKWGVSEKLRLGTLLIHLMAEITGLVTIQNKQLGKNKTVSLLMPTEAANEWLTQSHARCELLTPMYMPMVTQPRPWNSPWGGGYLSKKLRFPLIKTANKNYLEELSYVDMPMVYSAINALQDTKWTVNKAVLSVLQAVWDDGGSLGKLPPREDTPIPAKNFDTENPDPVALKEWKTAARKTHDANERNQSKRIQVSAKLWVAEKFAEYDHFHFPHALDWRGRAYPVSAGLNPQGDDVSKALLKFAEGKKLGTNGAYWLAVHGANCYGMDKVTFEDRVQWVSDHTDEILESALNPLNGSRFWADADSPYMFLAFCMEWAGYTIAGDEFVSHLSVSFDGTCNGLQNFSAMLRDEIGGAAVGLVPSDKPTDIYSVVKDRANAIIAQDALRGSTVAQRWGGKVTRQLTKRNTMTTPYGVSQYGMKDQLIQEFQKMREDGTDMDLKDDFTDAQYLASVNYAAIGDTVVAARVAMDWLQEVAKVVASNELPVSWTTPSGLPVLQSYREVLGKRYDFQVEGKRYQMTLNIDGDKLDRRKQSSGISPNFVHSLDAAHMIRTVAYCMETGVSSFAMIHDSYGTHAADADTLIHQLRRGFVDQYSGNVLEDFRTQLVGGLPPELVNKIPPVPPMGNLEISAVLDSEYFFA